MTSTAPRALLLDFGGVLVSTTARADWAAVLARRVVEIARTAGQEIDPRRAEESLRAGRAALSLWKDAASRRRAPRELAPREIVEDFLLADLPDPIRAAAGLDAQRLLRAKTLAVAEHRVRPGVPELLEHARSRGIALGVVSNAHSGLAHREVLRDTGLDAHIGVQVYSDEIGIRKPHPGMIHRALEALGIAPEESWYVGDTLDRDVVAGRRAGAGRVIITRDRRTDRTPFAVDAAPDLVLETPEGLLAELRRLPDHPRAAAPATPPTPTCDPAPETRDRPRRPALLLDHGGVITTSTPDPARDAEVGAALADLAARCGHALDAEAAAAAVAAGWERLRVRKRAAPEAEIAPEELWSDLIGRDLPGPLRPALRLEARELSALLHRAKGTMRPRAGALELIRFAAAHRVPLGIVSNTISGRSVREVLDGYGIGGLIGPAAYSDEVGVRKPGRGLFDAALAGLDVDPADVLHVGDKALNDGAGARGAGIGTVCLLRGGKDPEPVLARALAEGIADHVLDSPADVIGLLADRLSLVPATL